MTSRTMQLYHEIRLPYDRRRAVVWKAICCYLQRWIDAEQGVLELGAGYGEFSSQIQASQKWALEQNGDLEKYWAKSITPLIQSALEPWPIPEKSIGTVFASNFFEHFTQDQAATMLSEACRVLRPGGRLIVVQPNFRLQPRRYFDDYTHQTIYTDNSFADLLRALGWNMVHSEPRFLPFSMKSSLPTAEWLVRLYLTLPFRPLAGQFLVIAEKR